MKKEKIIKWVTRGIALFFALLLILTSVLYVASAQNAIPADYIGVLSSCITLL